MKTFNIDKLKVNVYDSRSDMGKAAAKDIKERIVILLKEKKRDKYDIRSSALAE